MPLKAEKNYLIGTNVILEINYLSFLGIILNCSILNITMLKQIAFIKFLNLILVCIIGNKNLVVDILSIAKYPREKEILTQEADRDLAKGSAFTTSKRV